MTRLNVLGVALAAATAVVLLLALARRTDALPEGLAGTYFSTANWDMPVSSAIDRQPSTASMVAAWRGDPPQVFSAMWTGSFIALIGGTYTIATNSDDGSWVYVDQRLVVDNGGNHSARMVARSIDLTRGVHTIVIYYFQRGGGMDLDVAWRRGSQTLEAVPGWALTPRRPTFLRFVVEVIVRRSLAVAEWLWVAMMLVGVAVAAWPRLAAVAALLRRDAEGRAVMAVIAGSLVLNATGFWCGLAAHTSWLGDELTPTDVLAALSRHFSNGWWVKYPPLQFYVLAAVYSPLLLLQQLGRIDLATRFWYDVLFVASRLVSVVAGAGVLLVVYLTGAGAFSRRAGLFAAASLALVVTFVGYSKIANVDVPYLFWFALSLLFYLRLLGAPTLRNVLLFAASSTLAVCTKDQAYALYLTAPLLVAHAIWRDGRHTGTSRPLARAFLDRRFGAAVAAAAIVFVALQNLIFNIDGFRSHVRYIMSDGSAFRMFEPTLAGRLHLLALTARLDQRSLGWPLFLVSLGGCLLAIVSPATRRSAIALSLIVISYYLGFINLILYNYDRFLLPVCVVQALFAGLALDRLVNAPHRRQRWRYILIGGVFAYSVLYASTLDVLMLRDSRYAVEQWLRGHVGPNQTIGTVFPLRNRPRLDDFQIVEIGTAEELQRAAPAYYVLDADYAQAVPAGSPSGDFFAGLQQETLGYKLILRYRSPAPWSWLPGAHPDLVGQRLEAPVSALRDINPTFEVYKRGS